MEPERIAAPFHNQQSVLPPGFQGAPPAFRQLFRRNQRLDPVKRLLRLLLHAAGNERARRRIKRDLTGGKHKAVCFDGLGIRTDGAGRRSGRNDFFHGLLLLKKPILCLYHSISVRSASSAHIFGKA